MVDAELGAEVKGEGDGEKKAKGEGQGQEIEGEIGGQGQGNWQGQMMRGPSGREESHDEAGEGKGGNKVEKNTMEIDGDGESKVQP